MTIYRASIDSLPEQREAWGNAYDQGNQSRSASIKASGVGNKKSGRS
jgi:hypothetical protein